MDLCLIWLGIINLAHEIYMERIPTSLLSQKFSHPSKGTVYMDPEALTPLRVRGNEARGNTMSQYIYDTFQTYCFFFSVMVGQDKVPQPGAQGRAVCKVSLQASSVVCTCLPLASTSQSVAHCFHCPPGHIQHFPRKCGQCPPLLIQIHNWTMKPRKIHNARGLCSLLILNEL